MFRIAFKLAVALMIFGSYSLQGQPRIQIDKDGLNLGTISVPPKHHKARAAVRNVGTDTLYIHRIDRNCRCTEFVLDSEIIAPGEFSTINVTINFDIERTSGKRSTELSIYSNDPLDSLVSIEFHAEVERPILIAPSAFPKIFGARAGRWSQSKVKLTNLTEEALIFGDPVFVDRTGKELEIEVLVDEQILEEGTPLPPGETVQLTLRFMSSNAAYIKGNLTIPMLGNEYLEFEAEFTAIIDHADGRMLNDPKTTTSGDGKDPNAGH